MTMYKRMTWGWELLHRNGNRWVQVGAAVGMTLQNATGGGVGESQLTAEQARLLRKRGFVVLGA